MAVLQEVDRGKLCNAMTPGLLRLSHWCAMLQHCAHDTACWVPELRSVKILFACAVLAGCCVLCT